MTPGECVRGQVSVSKVLLEININDMGLDVKKGKGLVLQDSTLEEKPMKWDTWRVFRQSLFSNWLANFVMNFYVSIEVTV